MRLLAVLGAMLAATGARAAGGGTSGAEFLRVAMGARPAALGESFVGLADDVSTVAWNPAGLGRLESVEFAAMHLSYLADASYEFLAACMPAGKLGTVALSGAYIGVKPFDSTISPFDPAGAGVPQGEAMDAFGAVSWGVPMAALVRDSEGVKDVYLGVSAKFIYRSLGGYDNAGTTESFTAFAAAADLGVFYQWKPEVGLGASVQNVGSKVRFLGDEDDSLPTIVRAGASWRAMQTQSLKLLLLAEGMKPLDQDGGTFESGTWGGGGAEFVIADMLALRAGFRQGPDGARVVGGAGFTLGSIGVDYAFVPISDLGAAGMQGHRMGLRMRMGGYAARRLPAPLDLKAASLPNSVTHLKWEPVAGAAGYHLELLKPGAKAHSRLTKEPRAAPEISLRGLKAGNEYGITVIPVDGGGREGRKAELTFVPRIFEVLPPAKLTGSFSNGAVKLTWTAGENAVGYHVYLRQSGGKWKQVTKNPRRAASVTLRGFKAGTYQFAVRSVDPKGKMSKARATSVMVE